MISVQMENFSEHMEEFKTLLPLHWQELGLNKDRVQLDPIYEAYLKKEADGELFVASARENGSIIGYYCGFIGRALHYRTMLMCTTDIYFVHPDRRKLDIGTMLFNFVEQQLKNRGVMYWVVGDKNHKPAAYFLELLGHEKIENYYSKWIGE